MGEQDNSNDYSNIQEAKLAVMEQVPYIRKTSGGDLPYSYASERAFIVKVRPVLVACGVTVAPVSCQLVENGVMQTSGGKPMAVRCIQSIYRFTHVPSGTFEDVAVVGEGADRLDKALPKAMTCAFKYALRQWLVIETGDDPDKIQDVDAMHLTPSAKAAAEAIMAAADKATLDKIEKKLAGSPNIGSAEKAHLVEALQEKRNEMLSLSDLSTEEGADG